jgi:uncharacterized protein (TIGR00730 family)
MRRLCVFCGSKVGNNPAYAESARALGTALARRGIGLVYGGGHIGLMGTAADAALAAGGEVIGVIPQGMVEQELAHRQLTELRIVRTMHERKALMAELSDAFIALPGGYGTLDETFEILTWAQLGLHAKPVGMWNVAGFFDPLLAWVAQAVRDGFVSERNRGLLRVVASVEEVLAMEPLAAPSFSLSPGGRGE